MNLLKKILSTGRFRISQNLEFVLRGADGRVKPLFQENKLAVWLMKLGLLSPRLAHVPLLFGRWAPLKKISNLVTNAGAAGVASRINGAGSEAAFTYIAVGTGTTAASVADTTLQTELAASGLSRASATASRVTTDVTNDTAQLVVTFTVTGTAAVTESGALNAASVGVLLARQVFSAINVVNGDSLQVTWKFDVD
ncbi:hypothetical protein HZB78_05650 [Candidatus Collierbacteria bacterium]|nr:hypothetical protein [Candidatus Collierbacteria bacterium]